METACCRKYFISELFERLRLPSGVTSEKTCGYGLAKCF